MGAIHWFCVLASLIVSVRAISPLTIKGSKFYDANGTQVFFKGVAYQRTPTDPFLDPVQCQQDAALMKTLGANAIRSYHVDPTGNHDGCMQAFYEAGIYVFLDVDDFATMIVQTSPSWTLQTFTAFTAVIDAFDKYVNVAGFFISNEGVNNPAGLPAAAYIKAAVRDTKAYMRKKGGRYVPMGYSSADVAFLRPNLQNYLACGPEANRIDFFALNSYLWCGQSTYEISGYADIALQLQGFPVPAFFSEVGCNAVRPRTFQDMTAVYGPMTPVLSGAIIYEWVQEVNNYGLIQYPNGGVSGVPAPIQPEFDNLKSQWLNATPVGTSANAYTPATTAFACPPTGGGWTLDGNASLPPAPANLTPPTPSTFSPTTHAPYVTSVNTAFSVIGGDTKTTSNVVGGSPGPSASASGGSAASGGDGSATASQASGSSTATAKSAANTALDNYLAFLALSVICIVVTSIVFWT